MKKVTIRIDLDPRLAKKFLKLKEKWHLKTNSDTVRHLIAHIYENEFFSNEKKEKVKQ